MSVSLSVTVQQENFSTSVNSHAGDFRESLVRRPSQFLKLRTQTVRQKYSRAGKFLKSCDIQEIHKNFMQAKICCSTVQCRPRKTQHKPVWWSSDFRQKGNAGIISASGLLEQKEAGPLMHRCFYLSWKDSQLRKSLFLPRGGLLPPFYDFCYFIQNPQSSMIRILVPSIGFFGKSSLLESHGNYSGPFHAWGRTAFQRLFWNESHIQWKQIVVMDECVLCSTSCTGTHISHVVLKQGIYFFTITGIYIVACQAHPSLVKIAPVLAPFS